MLIHNDKAQDVWHKKGLIKQRNVTSSRIKCSKFNFPKTEYVINRCESAIRCDAAWGPEAKKQISSVSLLFARLVLMLSCSFFVLTYFCDYKAYLRLIKHIHKDNKNNNYVNSVFFSL